MFLRLVAATFLCFPYVLNAQQSAAQQTAPAAVQLSRQELKTLLATAHTSDQYKQLAGYFHAQELAARSKAVAEKVERDRRAQVNAALYQKYPRPVDSAQYLYESYLADADRAAALAQHYDQLASQNEK
jgi:hypothetical protein